MSPSIPLALRELSLASSSSPAKSGSEPRENEEEEEEEDEAAGDLEVGLDLDLDESLDLVSDDDEADLRLVGPTSPAARALRLNMMKLEVEAAGLKCGNSQ